MTLTLVPDAEKIVSGYLRTHTSITALGARIVGKTPSSTDEPWVRVTQLDDRALGAHRADSHHEFYLQFDCYAGQSGGQPEASTLSRTVRAALAEIQGATLDAVVAGVDFRSHARIPDTDVDEPARERFVLTALVYMHGTNL